MCLIGDIEHESILYWLLRSEYSISSVVGVGVSGVISIEGYGFDDVGISDLISIEGYGGGDLGRGTARLGDVIHDRSGVPDLLTRICNTDRCGDDSTKITSPHSFSV